jgi:hypothetical protein
MFIPVVKVDCVFVRGSASKFGHVTGRDALDDCIRPRRANAKEKCALQSSLPDELGDVSLET